MSDLDASTYDLTTPPGQDLAISDIIDEQNRQFEQSGSLTTYSVVAYAQLDVDLIQGSPSGVYTTSFIHGLSYAPTVLAYSLNPDGSFFQPLPYVDTDLLAPGPMLTYQYASADESLVYFNVQAISTGGLFDTTSFSAGFYIFNIPAQV